MVTFPFSGYILTMLPFGSMVMLIPRIPDFFGSYSYEHVPESYFLRIFRVLLAIVPKQMRTGPCLQTGLA
jgi:hypothetical protein